MRDMVFAAKPAIGTRIGPEAWEAYRSVFRSLGPRHRIIDRLRYDLKWTIAEEVAGPWLAEERGKLVTKGGRA